MTVYRVDCYKQKKSIINADEKAYVKGKRNSLFNKTLIKADTIKNLSRELPFCECGEPELPNVKIFTEDIEKSGTVKEVHEEENGYWFLMEVKE